VDIIHKYLPDEARRLVALEEIPAAFAEKEEQAGGDDEEVQFGFDSEEEDGSAPACNAAACDLKGARNSTVAMQIGSIQLNFSESDEDSSESSESSELDIDAI
jgi:hypothetical protein